MTKQGTVVDIKYVKAKYFRASKPEMPEDIESKMYVACFMSAPNKKNAVEFSNWMCFADTEALLKYANELKTKAYKNNQSIDIEYSFVIKPGETYAQRTDLGSFLEELGIDPEKWEDEVEIYQKPILCIDNTGMDLAELEPCIYTACFTSTPNENYGDREKYEGFINEWMCFSSEDDILKFVNDLLDEKYKIDLEYSFIIYPKMSFMERVTLGDFLRDYGVDIGKK